MKFTQELVDKISDDFQSTFLLIDDKTISNMFAANEIPIVETIIVRHMGNMRMSFFKTGTLKDDYDIRVIKIDEEQNDQA